MERFCLSAADIGVAPVAEPVRLGIAGANLTGVRHDGVSRFGGIRYALAPTGPRRFGAPVPATLEGEIDARRVGPIGPQLPSLLRGAVGECHAPQAEDCLHLTVWTPGRGEEGLPVLVWIHGGAWQSGGAALGWYDGAMLARLGRVVVVAVNYRLGPLGWLCADGAIPNAGLLDQALALQWVVDHIAGFGGDPGAITLMGQSAGAVCVACLLAHPRPVQRVILQSAPLGRAPRRSEAAARVGEALLDAAGAPNLDAARDMPAGRLLSAQQAPQVQEALAAAADGQGLFCPVLDGSLLPLDFVFGQGAGQADVLIGSNHDEMAAFPGHGVGPVSAAQGDRLFAGPAHQWAADARAAGRRAWEYRFDATPTSRFGACHCVELPFVFGTWDAFSNAPMLQGLCRGEAVRLTQDVQGAWLAFIRGGSPPWPCSPHVHAFDTGSDRALAAPDAH